MNKVQKNSIYFKYKYIATLHVNAFTGIFNQLIAFLKNKVLFLKLKCSHQNPIVLSPDLGLRVPTNLHPAWLRETKCTDDCVEAENKWEESEEKQSWLAELSTFGSLDIWNKRKKKMLVYYLIRFHVAFI